MKSFRRGPILRVGVRSSFDQLHLGSFLGNVPWVLILIGKAIRNPTGKAAQFIADPGVFSVEASGIWYTFHLVAGSEMSTSSLEDLIRFYCCLSTPAFVTCIMPLYAQVPGSRVTVLEFIFQCACVWMRPIIINDKYSLSLRKSNPWYPGTQGTKS
eukprot:2198235-Rhodomonas_salina.1